MTKSGRFSALQLKRFEEAKILGVRAGTEHRYTGVWVVVADGRVLVRTWNDKPTGWYRAFRKEPEGSVQLGDTVLKVRAVPVRGAKLRRAATEAYARKYNTKASEKWVTGFAESGREANTLELVPSK